MSLAPRLEDPCHAGSRDLGVVRERCVCRFPCHPCVSLTWDGLRVLLPLAPRARATRAPRDLGVLPECCFGRFRCHPCVPRHATAHACYWFLFPRTRATRAPWDLGVVLEFCSRRFPCHPCVSKTCIGLRVSLAPRSEGPCCACASGLRCVT